MSQRAGAGGSRPEGRASGLRGSSGLSALWQWTLALSAALRVAPQRARAHDSLANDPEARVGRKGEGPECNLFPETSRDKWALA